MQDNTLSRDSSEDRASRGAQHYPVRENPGILGISDIRGMLWRQRFVIVGALILSLVAGLIITMLQTPMYAATSTVRGNFYGNEIVAGQDIADPILPTNEISRYLGTLAEVLASLRMGEIVVEKLEPQIVTRIAGEDIADLDRAKKAAANIIRGGVEVETPTSSRILQISYESDDALVAASVVNAFADALVQDSVRSGVDANQFAIEYLSDQIANTRAMLREAEFAANEYARANRLIAERQEPSQSEGSATAPTITGSNLVSVNQEYINARARRIAAEQRWLAVSDMPAERISSVTENEAVQALRLQLTNLEVEESALQQRYQDDYPQLQETRAEIATVSQRMSRIAEDLKNGIRDEFRISQQQENALAAERERLSGETLDEQDRRVQFNILARDAQAYRDQLQALLARYNQAVSAENIEEGDLSVLDYAPVPESPASPNLITNMIVAFILGIALAGGLSLLREIFDDRMRTVDDVERRLSLRVLGQTPYVDDAVEDAVDDPFDPISEAYSSIRASLDYALGTEGPHVVQMTSSQPGEGKTTTAAALARRFAMVGRRVLLVDADLRRPAINRQFGVKRRELGLIEMLHSRTSLDKALIPTDLENLHLLLPSEIPANPVEILSSGLFADLLSRVSPHYDLIILDSSPVVGIADAPLLSRFVDGVVFVVEANRAHFGQARTAIRRLRDVDAHILGAVFTKFRALEAGQSYNYSYEYYSYDAKDR